MGLVIFFELLLEGYEIFVGRFYFIVVEKLEKVIFKKYQSV